MVSVNEKNKLISQLKKTRGEYDTQATKMFGRMNWFRDNNNNNKNNKKKRSEMFTSENIESGHVTVRRFQFSIVAI